MHFMCDVIKIFCELKFNFVKMIHKILLSYNQDNIGYSLYLKLYLKYTYEYIAKHILRTESINDLQTECFHRVK